MSAPPPRAPSTWDHIRAVLVTIHLLAITIMSLPSPGRVSERQLRDPALQEVFADWREVLAGLGVALSKEEAEQLAMAGANSFMESRDAVLKPLRPYYKYAGTVQSWQMFGYLNRTPARFKLELRTAEGGWRDLYIARNDTADWRRGQLDSERFRGMINSYSWKQNRSGYRRFLDWISCRAAEDFPDAISVRGSMVRLRLPEPEELREMDALPEIDSFWRQVRNLRDCVVPEEEP